MVVVVDDVAAIGADAAELAVDGDELAAAAVVVGTAYRNSY